MKKMLVGSLSLLVFAVSISIIQASCTKTEAQSSSNAVAQLNKIIYAKNIPASANKEVWTANYDGTNAVQIPIIYTAGMTWTQSTEHQGLSISPDGQKMFIVLSPVVNYPPGQRFEIYSCDITGGTLSLVVPGGVGVVHAY